ncbi:tissue factor pathway inhibitor 2-like isoform X1 [Leptotrombidium deliense]|uniref:Tissue factor pathway inhibitor 2-like isoform X1 n=1 Tax=Leptotrombidium deliense TaxID=299467 RepID=A0A443S5N8_9ACAR|nr:tissue factor pathway inhibitor 2-like isoform X1 [Leptotrombidium deliense]
MFSKVQRTFLIFIFIEITFGLHEVCKQLTETGPCENWEYRWSYNVLLEKCEKFRFGGCEGNRNNFKTLSDCQAVCKKHSGRFLRIKKSEKTCSQPKDEGPCYGLLSRYFYNKETKRCEEFNYGGCIGNSNNFLSVEDCERRCIHNLRNDIVNQDETFGRDDVKYSYDNDYETVNSRSLDKDESLKICSLVAETGPCKKRIRRYFFNRYTKKCTPFVYGGCEGNQNNFMTLNECITFCSKSLATYSVVTGFSLATCRKLPESGPCKNFITKFYFNTITEQCDTFEYGGCGGNKNKFDSREECNNACTSMNPKLAELLSNDICKNEPQYQFDIAADCYKLSIAYSYNQTINECKRFFYSGCGGNRNRFKNKQLCVDTCVKKNL